MQKKKSAFQARKIPKGGFSKFNLYDKWGQFFLVNVQTEQRQQNSTANDGLWGQHERQYQAKLIFL